MKDFMIKCILYCSFVLNVHIVESNVFPKNERSIVEKEGFLMHLVHPVKFKLHKCSLKLEDGTSFDLDPLVKDPFIYNTTEGVQIQRFNQEVCGVRVKNIAKSMSGNWTLFSEGDRQEIDQDWFMLDVSTNKVDKSPLVIKISKDKIFQPTSCPNNKDARYCRIFDHSGISMETNGQCDISVTSFGNETFYDCRTMRYGQMEEIKSSIKVVMENPIAVIKAVITETDTHFILTCKDEFERGMCRAEMPGKTKQFLLQEGLLMDHYSTLDTEFNKGRCSVEIEKPLRPEDIGTWRIYHSKTTESGCVFRVQDNSPIPQSNANDPKKIEYWKNKYNSLTIECEVPYQIDYCYLSTPDFPTNENFTSLSPYKLFKTKFLGMCRFIINEPISGLYVCGVNSIYGGEDIQTYYDVKVYDVPVKTSTSFVQGAKGKLIDLMIKTIFDYPINYCRFMMPNGQVHGVSERFNMTGALRFYGKGLQYGECGIQIVKVTDDDFGVWKVTFQVEEREYSVELVLTKQGGFSAAYVAGPILAVVVIGVFVLGYFAYKKRSSRRQRGRYDRTVGTTTDDLNLDNYSQASHES